MKNPPATRPLTLSFRLDEVPQEGRAFAGALDSEKLAADLPGLVGALGYRPGGEARVSGMVYRSARDEIVIDGKVEVDVGFDCVRCLKGLTLAVAVRNDHVLVRRTKPKTVDDDGLTVDEDDLDEPDVETFEGEQVELAELFRQDLLLALPMNPSCDDIAGKTQCDTLQVDAAPEEEQIDPRWAPLLELKKKMT